VFLYELGAVPVPGGSVEGLGCCAWTPRSTWVRFKSFGRGRSAWLSPGRLSRQRSGCARLVGEPSGSPVADGLGRLSYDPPLFGAATRQLWLGAARRGDKPPVTHGVRPGEDTGQRLYFAVCKFLAQQTAYVNLENTRGRPSFGLYAFRTALQNSAPYFELRLPKRSKPDFIQRSL